MELLYFFDKNWYVVIIKDLDYCFIDDVVSVKIRMNIFSDFMNYFFIC